MGGGTRAHRAAARTDEMFIADPGGTTLPIAFGCAERGPIWDSLGIPSRILHPQIPPEGTAGRR